MKHFSRSIIYGNMEMQFAKVYDVESPKKRNQKKKGFHKKHISLESIFRLPRSALSSFALSPSKEKSYRPTPKVQALRQRNTQFITEYRDHLRRTIFTQTKDNLHPNNKCSPMQIQRVIPMKDLQKSHNKKIHSSKERKDIDSLHQHKSASYHTIISNGVRRHVEPTELSVNKLPIIYKIEKSKRKRMINQFLSGGTVTDEVVSPRIPGHYFNFRTNRVVGVVEKSEIQPWETIQEIHFAPNY